MHLLHCCSQHRNFVSKSLNIVCVFDSSGGGGGGCEMMKKMIVNTIFILTAISSLPIGSKHSAKAEAAALNINEEVYKFLKRYGYLNDVDEKDDLKMEGAYATALAKYQETYGLNVTGTLTAETMTSMKTPRCGVPDFSNMIQNGADAAWAMKDLTWNFYMASPEEVKVAEAAFKVWEKHSALKFTRSRTNPNILISYKSLRHTYTADPSRVCTDHFDGRGSVLAHAYYPRNEWTTQLEIHMDKDETWFKDLTPPPNNMTSLLHMLIHEIGHALGIHHTNVPESVMFGFYHIPKTNFADLHITDVPAIQNLYGKPTERENQPVYAQPPPPAQPTAFKPSLDVNSSDNKQNISICGHMRRKYHFLVAEKRLLIFYKKWAWAMNLMRKQLTPAQLLSNWLPFLSDEGEEIDAIYQRPLGL